ncbi:hypothetical protein GPECTOR_55g309 [Gonium pectorale]|uniref:Ankyrin repeat domain-containing protein n=1 Tax=Gonium pectorale TaxID=33097 RepID=A0A150G6K6_GONPE|nr:hypothetical protein GPECTOR_55g309 [Gonium pectorale]|eukprot:KXZ45403.1 hypothetical protein GPECTOR_55g309 [Gonium pectorale]
MAARSGHLRVLAWLVETLGAEAVGMGPALFAEAAKSGRVELLAWLRERGCGWSQAAYTLAAGAGCEEALEWLENGAPYADPCGNGDLATVLLLRRLGVPWGPAGHAMSYAAYCAPVPMLRWLLAEGFPMGDYKAARAAVAERDKKREEVLELLEGHWRAHEGAAAAVVAVPR